MSLQRVKHIDLFRGIGIIIMIMGHIGFGNAFIHFIHAFHMPMFFLVSGFFFSSEYSWKCFVGKKLKTLVLPYFFSGFFLIMLRMIEDRNYDMFFINIRAVLCVNSDAIPYGGAIWFLIALFWAEILYMFVCRSSKSFWIQNIIVILIALAGNFCGKFLPFSLGPGFVGVAFLHVGKLIYSSSNKICTYIKELKGLHCFLIGIIEIVLIFLNGYVSMRTSTYSNILLFWFNAIMSSLVGFNICRILVKSENICKVTKIIQKIGKDSIVYLCFNQFVIYILNQVIYKMYVPLILKWSIVLLGTLMILHIFQRVITNTPLKKVFGR